MTASLTLVGSDMKNALTLHAPPSPIPEEPPAKVQEPSKHIAALWDPWHELGLYDPIRNVMPCLGREPLQNGAPCRWEVEPENTTGITIILAKLAQTAPQDVDDNDLNSLLRLGICNKHIDQLDEVRAQGLQWLQYRLNIARMHHERMERLMEDVRKLRTYIQQLQSSLTPGGIHFQIRHQDAETDHLRARINHLEHATLLSRMETEKVEADAIDREAKLDRTIQDRESRIEDLTNDIARLKSQHEDEKRRLVDQIQYVETKAGTLEEQGTKQHVEVEKLKMQLQVREKEHHGKGECEEKRIKKHSWRCRLRNYFRRKRKAITAA